jgi:predicted DNA-binding mobile mystery protein A
MKTKVDEVASGRLDQWLGPLRQAQTAALRPVRGWLRAVRDAVGLSQEDVARKLGTKRQSYAQLETAEERGAISLASLRRAAEAMDCELVYFVVPRENIARTYSELAQIHDPKFEPSPAGGHAVALEGEAAADLMPRRKSPGWDWRGAEGLRLE